MRTDARSRCWLIVIALVCAPPLAWCDDEEQPEEGAAAAPANPSGVVYLQDGSVIKGQVVDMAGGKLKLKLTSGDEITVSWSDVKASSRRRPRSST